MFNDLVFRGDLEGIDFGEYEKILEKEIKYWNGKDWTNKLAMSNPW
jgi:hypothetical protein